MNIKQAKAEITNTVSAYLLKDENGYYKIPVIRQRPILLIGPPGIGKTQIMEQIAKECHIGLVAYTITHHTRQSAVGLPYIVEENYDGHTCSVTKYTMSEIIASIYDKIEQSGQKEGILFIDEINCVSETLAPTMLQFLQCKTFGNQSIPNGWIIVAAGNPPEYNKSVRDFDMVTLDRVRLIHIEPDYTVWKEYAINNHINHSILTYLELKQDFFYRVETDVDGLKYVTARGWEDLSQIIDVYEELKINVTEQIIQEFLHNEDVAQDFSAYYDLYNKYKNDYGINEILSGNIKPYVFERLLRASFDERLCVVSLVNNALNNQYRNYIYNAAFTDMWYHFIKTYQKLLSNKDDNSSAYEKYGSLFNNYENEFNNLKKAGYTKLSEIKMRESFIKSIKDSYPEQKMDNEAAFSYTKSVFEKMAEELDYIENAAGKATEFAFDFMEQAFETPQEMVVFVTELAVSEDSAIYLSEHECKRYIAYSSKFLNGDEHALILEQINRP